MDADGRQPPAVGQRTRQGGPAQQRADQSGARGIGDAVQLLRPRARRRQRIAHQRQQALHVIARGQLRDYAAIYPVQVDLAPQPVRQQPALLVEHRDGTFVAGGFYGEDSHRLVA